MYMAVLNFSVIAVKPVRNTHLVFLAAWRNQTEAGQEELTQEHRAPAFKRGQAFFSVIPSSLPDLCLSSLGSGKEASYLFPPNVSSWAGMIPIPLSCMELPSHGIENTQNVNTSEEVTSSLSRCKQHLEDHFLRSSLPGTCVGLGGQSE